jgi:NTP pyrophosphatase (non-canonical NTP hydrolase)
MDANDYQREAMRTCDLTQDPSITLNHAAMGMCSEAGEACGFVLKHQHHGRALDQEKVLAEIGDVLWYAAEACSALGVNLGDVMEANLAKLRKRWPEGFKRGTVEAGGDTAIAEAQALVETRQ